ncbi:MAG: 1,4-dihydroxy-2-naphthoate octaprenyltransferase [Bacteroidaceae bacterium]
MTKMNAGKAPNKGNGIKTNSLKAWFLAARPKTLTGAAAPVILALALAWKDISTCNANPALTFEWIPAILCLLFALMMQIDANFINDYFDCVNGVDGEERLGPKRACAQGWISLAAMRRAIVLTTASSLLLAFPTIWWGGWKLIIIGLLCAFFAFLYTTCLARRGLGDILVLVFFGIIPVCVTYYVQLHHVPISVWVLSVAMGLVTDNLLVVNNYRDRDTDAKVGKNTLVITIGTRAAEWLYLILGITGVILCQWQWFESRAWGAMLPVLYLVPHISAWKSLVRINHGKSLNKVLGITALHIFLFAILAAIGTLL